MTTTNTVVHVFYDIPMSWSHASLTSELQRSAKIDELDRFYVALFINCAWNAFKLLGANNTFLYHRSPTGGAVSVETIRRCAAKFGGPRLTFSKNLESHLIKAYETAFGKASTIGVVAS